MNTVKLNTIGEVVKKVESGGSSGSGGDWRYYASDTPIPIEIIGVIAHKVKYQGGGVKMSTSYFINEESLVFAIAYDALTLLKDRDGVVTFQEALMEMGISEESMSQFGLRKITEEEFYA